MALDENDLKIIEDKIKHFLGNLEQRIIARLENLDVPDVRNLTTKKLLSDTIQELKTGFNDEITKVQQAVTKVAEETEVKIKALTPPASKPWYATLLD